MAGSDGMTGSDLNRLQLFKVGQDNVVLPLGGPLAIGLRKGHCCIVET